MGWGSGLEGLWLDIEVEIPALDGLVDVTGADAEIAEALACLTFLGIARDDGGEQGFDILGLHAFLEELGKALAGEAAAEVNIVFARSAADEGDLRDVGTGTAVRAAGHADGDGIVAQAVFLDGFLELGEQIGQVTLRLGQRESAGG